MSIAKAGNDFEFRHQLWRRYRGDEWAAFDALPPAIRQRLREHSYDAWSVNTLMVWRRYRRLYPAAKRAERALIRYLDYCERLERQAYAEAYARQHGTKLPHEAAAGSILRYRR